MNRLYAEGTLCRFSEAAGKNTQVELTEPMNNNHVFASAEKTTSSNSVRQHGANKVLYVYCQFVIGP